MSALDRLQSLVRSLAIIAGAAAALWALGLVMRTFDGLHGSWSRLIYAGLVILFVLVAVVVLFGADPHLA